MGCCCCYFMDCYCLRKATYCAFSFSGQIMTFACWSPHYTHRSFAHQHESGQWINCLWYLGLFFLRKSDEPHKNLSSAIWCRINKHKHAAERQCFISPSKTNKAETWNINASLINWVACDICGLIASMALSHLADELIAAATESANQSGFHTRESFPLQMTNETLIFTRSWVSTRQRNNVYFFFSLFWAASQSVIR